MAVEMCGEGGFLYLMANRKQTERRNRKPGTTFKDIPNKLLPPARVISLKFQNLLRQYHRLQNECFRHGIGQISYANHNNSCSTFPFVLKYVFYLRGKKPVRCVS